MPDWAVSSELSTTVCFHALGNNSAPYLRLYRFQFIPPVNEYERVRNSKNPSADLHSLPSSSLWAHRRRCRMRPRQIFINVENERRTTAAPLTILIIYHTRLLCVVRHSQPSTVIIVAAKRVRANDDEPGQGHDGYFWSFPASDWSTKNKRWIFFLRNENRISQTEHSAMGFAPRAHQYGKNGAKLGTHNALSSIYFNILPADGYRCSHSTLFVHREWHQQGLLLLNRCAPMFCALMWQPSWEHLLHFTDADDYNTNLIQNTWFIILARTQASKRWCVMMTVLAVATPAMAAARKQ